MAKILTVHEAAEKLRVSADVVRKHLRLGDLPGRKVGNAWCLLDTDLEQWIHRGQRDAPRQRVSARGFLSQFPGRCSSEEFMAEKHENL